ncbi:MAG: hypothetical protein IJ493_08310 [Clostridia bacterium]|nr:hypothetical protein [Clostridia bacterium]
MMKKNIYTLTALLCAAAMLTGCGSSAAPVTEDTTTTSAVTTEAESTGYTSSIPKQDFGGETITFWTYSNSSARIPRGILRRRS